MSFLMDFSNHIDFKPVLHLLLLLQTVSINQRQTNLLIESTFLKHYGNQIDTDVPKSAAGNSN